ncbi:hypothetical protein BC936DRAFT_149554 [Jimgerdemannia flammicorona]|uniref:Uncharacterized protein n=2 Tax=Jimgerdemannia flammicorona TaxID=994334 RepID=A0A433D0M3_9FUNG|nr:hypothetical protein BC936DRAFT_149554 [Jimgerdemannia flammicorona]RUS24120.1 hypothetical protein BC938DRAFT_474089 [Jimgerdemannia flammicorona]
MDNLPYLILAQIFTHVADAAKDLCRVNKNFYALSQDSVTRANYLITRYGRYLSLGYAIAVHPRILTKHVAQILLKKGAAFPRYLAQKLAGRTNLSMRTAAFLMNRSCDTYGEHRSMAEDDWRAINDLFRQILCHDTLNLAEAENSLDCLLTESNFVPIPGLSYDITTYWHTPFEKPLFLMSVYKANILIDVFRQGYHLSDIYVPEFISNFIAEGMDLHCSNDLIARGLQLLIDHDVVPLQPADISQLLADYDEPVYRHDIQILKRLTLPPHIRMPDIVRGLMTASIEQPDPYVNLYYFPHCELYAQWPCPDAIIAAVERTYRVPLSAGDDPTRIAVPELPPLTAQWILETMTPAHPSPVRILFDNLVLAVARNSSGYFLDVFGPPSKRQLFDLYLDARVPITKRHVRWMRFCRNEPAVRLLLAKIRQRGAVAEDEDAYDDSACVADDGSDLLVKPAMSPALRGGYPMAACFGRPASLVGLGPSTSAKASRASRRRHGEPSPSSGGSSSSAAGRGMGLGEDEAEAPWRRFLEEVLEEERRRYEERMDAESGVRQTRSRKRKEAGKSVFHVVLEEVVGFGGGSSAGKGKGKEREDAKGKAVWGAPIVNGGKGKRKEVGSAGAGIGGAAAGIGGAAAAVAVEEEGRSKKRVCRRN